MATNTNASTKEAQEHLKAKEKELKKQLEEIEEESPSSDEFRSLDNAPEEDASEADTGTRLNAMKDMLLSQLKKVSNALLKMRHGSYSVCDRCGKPISAERLKVMPEAIYCIDCERELEESE